MSVGRAHVRNVALREGVANDGKVQLLIADVLQDRGPGRKNRLEFRCGGFSQAKFERFGMGDGQHFYNTQLCPLATDLGVPEEVRSRAPVTETHLLEQTHAETDISLPYHPMDLCISEPEQSGSVIDVEGATSPTAERVKRYYADTTDKWVAMRYLHGSSVRVEAVTELGD